MARACGQGKVGATNVRAKRKVVTQPKPKKKPTAPLPPCHEYRQNGRVSKKVLKCWLLVTHSGHKFAKGINGGLPIMAARGTSTEDSQWGRAEIVGPDRTTAHRWIVKFDGESKAFERSLGFHQFKVAQRVHVADDDGNGYHVATLHPPKWVTPVLVPYAKATTLCSLL